MAQEINAVVEGFAVAVKDGREFVDDDGVVKKANFKEVAVNQGSMDNIRLKVTFEEEKAIERFKKVKFECVIKPWTYNGRSGISYQTKSLYALSVR